MNITQNYVNEADIREHRIKAFLPFAFFCVVLIGSYITLRVDLSQRPIPQPMTAGQAQQSKAQTPAPSPMEGKSAPMFALPSLDGKTVSLADHKGKIVFINLWATWCEPCREEMPSMQRLYEKLKGPKFEMLAVSVDKDGESVVRPFVKSMNLTFPVLLDVPNEVYNLYQATGVPETYIVSSDGTVLHHIVGPYQWDNQDVVDALLHYIDRAP